MKNNQFKDKQFYCDNYGVWYSHSEIKKHDNFIAKETAREILQKLEKGETFDDLLKEYFGNE